MRQPVLKPPRRTTTQRGASLFIALMMLAVIALMGASAATLLQLDEQAARNYRAREQAWLAAQAGLDDALAALGGRLNKLGTQPDRQGIEALFPTDIGCNNTEDLRGFCRGTPSRPAWTDGQGQAISGAATYGQSTGARFSGAAHADALPQYFIELLEPSSKNGVDDSTPPLFRLTAIGFGPQGAQVRLQSTFGWRSSADNPVPLQPLAWRELPFSY